MLKNYFKIAFRNLIKHKSYSLINVVGLTVGIACLALIINYVRYELSYDKFNENVDYIYRITGDQWAETPVPLSKDFSDFFPEVVNTVRINKVDNVLLSYGKENFYENHVIFADPSIFSVFTFPLLVGNPQTALADPYSVVITKETAIKYFGNQNPIGKKINYDDRIDFTVTGVIKNIPNNSHLKFDFVFSLGSAQTVFYKDFFDNRMNTVVYNYFQLNPQSNIAMIEARLDGFTKSFLGEKLYKATRSGKWKIDYQIQSLKSIHLHSNLSNELEPNGDITNVYIFTGIAIIILLIACINYINLSTARYMNRLKEIGIRKIVGASRRQIIFQFIGESFLFSLLAVVLVAIILKLAGPLLSSVLEQKEMFESSGYDSILLLIGMAIITGLVSGIFPALFLSRFHPIFLLSKKMLRTNKKISFANLLVVFQFVVSTVLIIVTLIINNQLSYLQNKKLGFNKEQVIVVPLQDKSIVKNYELLKKELLQQSSIINISASSAIPGGVRWVRSFGWEGKTPDEDNTISYIKADRDFLKTYQIKLIEGRDFSESLSTDTSSGFLVNEAALLKLGWESPIGKRIETFERYGTVIGVVDNFNFKSLHEKIEPLVIYYDAGSFEYLSIRIKTSDISVVLSSIESKWKSLFPGKPYKYYFMDDYWGKLYQKEQSMKSLFSSFAGLAIFIACLGLFGLAAFSAQNKIKEIGIRKVLGASVPSILVLLSRDFMKWIIIANTIAFPIAYYIMNKWLQDFAYRIEISWWIFVLSGGIALLIALVTVSFQAIKAATANPVESLRYE